MTTSAHALRAAALLLAAAVSACAQPPAPTPAPLAAAPPPAPPPPAEHLDLPLDADHLVWQAVSTSPLPGGGSLREYVPAGETIADWSQMISTLTLPADQNPTDRLTAMLDAMRAACRAWRVLHDGTENLLARCDHPDDTADANIVLRQHEAILAKTLQGRTQNYLVLRAWHADKLPRDSVLSSSATRQQWQNWANQVALTHGT